VGGQGAVEALPYEREAANDFFAHQPEGRAGPSYGRHYEAPYSASA
jgi:hypothetical protein